MLKFKTNCALIVIIIIFSTSLFAQWSGNPQIGTAISVAADDQNTPVIVSDGLGGAIIAWIDHRDGENDAIYAQRINSQGFTQWLQNGVPVCTVPGAKQTVKMVEDGNGGAILTWFDVRSDGDVYAQRINNNGTIEWSIDGVAICNAQGIQFRPSIASDGAGGAIISWEDKRDFNYHGIYAQRVSSEGINLWDENGLVISYMPSVNCVTSNIISDNNGGAFISWADNRNGTFNDDIFIQHVTASGEISWVSNGRNIISASSLQQFPEMLLDNANGLMIAWSDNRSNVSSDIYIQKIDIDTAGFYWAANGVPICTTSSSEDRHKMVTDGAGGAILTWERHTASGRDVYAQKIDSAGQTVWVQDGIVICDAISDQILPSIISDGNGGAIIVWQDFRLFGWDIYAQKVNSSGEIEWTNNGIIISNAWSFQIVPQLIPHIDGGAIVVWQDTRSGVGDIYAERVLSGGTLTTDIDDESFVISQYSLFQNFPNPFNPGTKISWQSPVSSHQSLKVYDILGNEVATLIDEYMAAGKYETEFNADQLSSGIYFYKLTAGEFVSVKKMTLIK